MDIDIYKFLKKLNVNSSEVTAIGNHDLNRHFVYSFLEDNVEKVIKRYYVDYRLQKELEAYQIAKKSKIPTAKVLSYGRLDNHDYLIMEKVFGETLIKELNNTPNLSAIYKEMGEYLGALHNNRSNIPKDYKKTWMEQVSSCNNILMNLNCQDSTKQIFKDAYKIFTEEIEYITLNDIPFGYCHRDFDERNVMVKEGNISAIIDFEKSKYWNTELDLVQLYRKTLLGNLNLRNAFMEGYKSVMELQEAFNERLYLYLIADCLENCCWAYDQARSYFDENVEFLEKYLCEKGLGRLLY